jgi:hypothetical protein
MGLLSFFTKNKPNKLAPIPKGSFTVDRQGRIMTSTLPRAFPEERLVEIGSVVVKVLHTAKAANIPFVDLFVKFGALKVHAREMRGGAIIFLTPLT